MDSIIVIESLTSAPSIGEIYNNSYGKYWKNVKFPDGTHFDKLRVDSVTSDQNELDGLNRKNSTIDVFIHNPKFARLTTPILIGIYRSDRDREWDSNSSDFIYTNIPESGIYYQYANGSGLRIFEIILLSLFVYAHLYFALFSGPDYTGLATIALFLGVLYALTVLNRYERWRASSSRKKIYAFIKKKYGLTSVPRHRSIGYN